MDSSTEENTVLQDRNTLPIGSLLALLKRADILNLS